MTSAPGDYSLWKAWGKLRDRQGQRRPSLSGIAGGNRPCKKLSSRCTGGVSVHRVEDVTEALWGMRRYPDMNQLKERANHETARADNATA